MKQFYNSFTAALKHFQKQFYNSYITALRQLQNSFKTDEESKQASKHGSIEAQITTTQTNIIFFGLFLMVWFKLWFQAVVQAVVIRLIHDSSLSSCRDVGGGRAGKSKNSEKNKIRLYEDNRFGHSGERFKILCLKNI